MIVDKIDISIKKTAESNLSKLDTSRLPFGKTFSDHMFVADYANGAWTNYRIEPYGKLEFSPSCLVFHYGQAIFEGMKAYRTIDNKVALFRPEANIARFNKSAQRMCMPEVPDELFMEALKKLVEIDSEWVPKGENNSLYIRPFMIATDEYLGVKASEKYKFIIVTGPVGPYYTEPVKVCIETKYTRAFEGGTGFAKAAGNYAATLLSAKRATLNGYTQMVWTDAFEHNYIEEAGTMNMMFVIDNVLITPPLSTTILAGVTRDSVIKLAKELNYKVEERKIGVMEIVSAASEGRLQEAFGTGTAATIAQICLINYEGKDIVLPMNETTNALSNSIAKHLSNIRTGVVPDTNHWLTYVN